jgi:hypothetical protein
VNDNLFLNKLGVAIKSFPLIGFLLLLTACSSLPVIKNVANELESIPLGLSKEQIYLESYNEKLKSANLVNVRPKMNLWLMRSPEVQTIYRQWPKGILLYLEENDFYYSLPVKDNKYRTGSINIYFDKHNKYKGYFAYSDMYYSKDTEARFDEENLYYYENGMDKERELAIRRFELFEQDTHNMENYFPDLPLRRSGR